MHDQRVWDLKLACGVILRIGVLYFQNVGELLEAFLDMLYLLEWKKLNYDRLAKQFYRFDPDRNFQNVW